MKRWLTWAIASSLFFMHIFLQMCVGVIVKEISDAFHIHEFGIGLLASSYYFFYILLQLPAGMIADYLGARSSLIFSATFMGLGTLLFSQANAFWLALLARFFMGFAAAFVFVSTLALLRHWFPQKRFGFMAGLTETVGLLGILFGTLPFAALLKIFSWRELFVVVGLLIFLIQIVTIFCVQNYPGKQPFISRKLKVHQFIHNSKLILSNGVLWINGLYAGIIFSILTVFFSLWGIPFFIVGNHLTDVEATSISSIGIVGVALGIPLLGLIYHELKEIKFFMALCSLLSAILFSWIIFFTPSSLLLCQIVMFFLGIITSVYIFNFALANHIAPQGLAGTSIGFTNALSLVITPLFQLLVGWIIEFSSSTPLVDYQRSLALLPILLLISGMLAFWIPSGK